MFNHLLHLHVKSEIRFHTNSSTCGLKHFIHTNSQFATLRLVWPLQQQPCLPVAPLFGWIGYNCFLSFSTPSRVHLVCSVLSVCLFHFHALDWFKLNCPSCSYRAHPRHFRRIIDRCANPNTRQVHMHCVGLQLSTSTEAEMSCVKGPESQLPPSLWMCVGVYLYLQWGKWAKATESICSNVGNLVLTQITGDEGKKGVRCINKVMSLC